jgi:acetylornithine/N-succinyldiaminopimelate aminotransferase
MIAFDQSFHGDTQGSLSVTGRKVYRDPFRPLLPDITFLPFNDLHALDQIDDRTACVITEPVQGEGGVRVPDRAWMKKLRRRCDETGALLIFDEIQTGFGRTGTLFAFEQFDVVPDILTLAKAMGGGMPIGAFVSSRDILSAFRNNPPLSHVTTFGGHPVSCAAGHAALNVLMEENLPDRALEIGQHIRRRIVHTLIREVRVLGSMLGMELMSRKVSERVAGRCLEAGVLLGWTLLGGAAGLWLGMALAILLEARARARTA